MRQHKTRQIRKDRPVPYRRVPVGRQELIHNSNNSHHHQSNNSHSSQHQSSYQTKRPSQIQLPSINRKFHCPFLIRAFYSINDENTYENEILPEDRQLRLHLWPNSTFKQIIQLLKILVPSLRSKQKFTFWVVKYNKEKKKYQKSQIATVYKNKRFEKSQQKQLRQTRFQIGDIIDVSVCYK